MTTNRVDVIDRSVEKTQPAAANRVLMRHISAGETGNALHELPRRVRALLVPEGRSTMDKGDVSDVSGPRL